MGCHDILNWNYGKTGIYTIKSGYHLQKMTDKEDQITHVTISSNLQSRNSFLVKIWRTNMLPKIKIIWWKVRYYGLHVAQNLNIGGCRIQSCCQVCEEENENIDHMLLHCRVAK